MAKGQNEEQSREEETQSRQEQEKSRAGGVAVYAGLAYYREDQEIILI